MCDIRTGTTERADKSAPVSAVCVILADFESVEPIRLEVKMI